MGGLKLHSPWWNGSEHKGFVWEFRLSISGIFSWNTPFQMRQSVGQHPPPSKTVQRHPGDRPCSICCRRVSTSGLSGVEKVSLVHSTGKSLDRFSTTIWAGVGQVNWAHDLHRSLTSGLKLNSKSWMSNVETCKYNVQSRMSEAKI